MHFKIDEYHGADGVIQKLNPALKLSLIIAFPVMASAAAPQKPERLLLIFFFTLALAAVSKIPFKAFIGRSLPAVPFVLYAAAVFFYGMISGGSLFMDSGLRPDDVLKDSALGFIYIDFLKIKTYEQIFALALMLKIFIGLNSVIVFSAATSFNDLSGALYVFKFPAVFVRLFKNTWRYLQDFINELLIMEFSSRLRFFKPKNMMSIKTFAMMFSALFIKSFDRAENNNLAMKLRGGGFNAAFKEEFYPAPALNSGDYKFTAIFFAFTAFCFYI
ncbi:MAG TPA: CbiQ family ECF transporter T component [Candidatus Wallbacteria bacterium]|nr:CbiQ family ECF transporter T component [Candidatus Wallbacteria bacterium]